MANQAFIKNLNERRVLTLLRVEQRLTRADIARRLDLMRSTVTNIVDDLIERGLVSEVAQGTIAKAPRQEMGRPGVDVALSSGGSYFVGAEIGVGLLRLVLMDMTLQVLRKSEVSLGSAAKPDQVVKRIADFLAKCQQGLEQPERIRSVSVTVPGLVRSDGFIVHLPILGWKDVNFLEVARQRLNLPVLIDNNANAAAFGEVYCHPKESRDLIVFLKLGNGCGGAAIINGRLLRGTSGTAAEFGHMRVGGQGPVCSCGRHGCLEPLVNLDALNRYLEMSGFRQSTDPTEVAVAADKGDRKAQAAVTMYVDALVRGIITIANLFNPSDIVLGGTLRPIVEVALSLLTHEVQREIVPGMAPPKLALSRNGFYECAIGAAALAHQQEFDEASVGLA